MSIDPTLIDPKAGPLAHRSARGGVIWGLIFLAHAGVMGALAFSESFAEGRATFGAQWARYALGALGISLGAVAVRSLLRSLRGWEPPAMDSARRTRARVVGMLFMDVGTALMLVAFVSPIAEATVDLHGWVRFYFGAMGIVYMLLGLTFFVGASIKRAAAPAEGPPRSPARAVIQEVRDTGITAGDSPRVELELDVSLDGSSTRRVTWEGLVPRLAIGRLVPGFELPVLMDPLDEDNIEIEWGKR